MWYEMDVSITHPTAVSIQTHPVVYLFNIFLTKLLYISELQYLFGY